MPVSWISRSLRAVRLWRQTKIDLILTDPPCHVRRELSRQTFDDRLFNEDGIAGTVDMCADDLKLGGPAHIFRSSDQLSSWDKAVSVSNEWDTFQDSKDNGQVWYADLFDQENQRLVYMRYRRNFSRNRSQGSIYHINMFEQEVHIWKKGTDLDCAFLDVSYHIQKPYDQRLKRNTNVTPGVPKLPFTESVLDMDHAVGESGSRAHVWPEPEPVLMMTHLINKVLPQRGKVLDFYMGPGHLPKPVY